MISTAEGVGHDIYRFYPAENDQPLSLISDLHDLTNDIFNKFAQKSMRKDFKNGISVWIT